MNSFQFPMVPSQAVVCTGIVRLSPPPSFRFSSKIFFSVAPTFFQLHKMSWEPFYVFTMNMQSHHGVQRVLMNVLHLDIFITLSFWRTLQIIFTFTDIDTHLTYTVKRARFDIVQVLLICKCDWWRCDKWNTLCSWITWSQ